jgi:hypothetical protein
VSAGGSGTPPIHGFREECELLAPLESFDPAAFVGDARVSQDVCNFVLTLALAYNDCKDAIYAHTALVECKPAEPPRKTKVWGAFAGAQFHAFRAVASVIHEVCERIREDDDVLRDEFFCSVVRDLPAPSREAWEALVDVALQATPKEGLGKHLHRLRNKLTFHYDPAALFIGYEEHFLSERKRDDRAFVSRGENMRGTRFFFADAAATGYARSVAGTEAAEELRGDLQDAVNRVNHGLMVLVTTFIARRGRAYRREVEG